MAGLLNDELARQHKYFAVEANNRSWDLIEVQSRSSEEDHELLAAAHASLFHWRQVGRPIEVARAYGTISRAYISLQQPELALRYAVPYLEALKDDPEKQDWDLGFAHSAMARCYACMGNEEQFKIHYEALLSAVSSVKDRDDLKILEADLAMEPWFGLRPHRDQQASSRAKS